MRLTLISLIGSLFVFTSPAFATFVGRTLTCQLSYELQDNTGNIKYVTPENGNLQKQLLDIRFCTNGVCEIKQVGSAFLGSSLGGASIRIVGEKTVIVLRDAEGHRAAGLLNTFGLHPFENGPATFVLNASGVYQDQRMSAIIYACQLI